VKRRDLVIAGFCLSAGAVAFALTPHRRETLLGALRLADIAPLRVGAWSSEDVTDLVAPAQPGSLAARLYRDVLQRTYQRTSDQTQVMMLLAHGDTQSNQLQLHRPEACYPAFGFDLHDDLAFALPLMASASLPARRLVADAPGRRENIVYWTRLGEYLPTDDSEQSADRLRTAMSGVISDGLLARFSIVSDDTSRAMAQLCAFIPEFIRAVDSAHRSVFVGTARARTLASLP
jgi:EpsI family protein